MTESAKAVFLSYASQDAEAAQRICAALRAADIEVWFDQSELRGGDAWDRRIRTQIRDSALFLPLVSEVTAERPEGYFRLEWSLAEQRAQMIARGTPFVIPILLGNAPKSQDLPDEFRRVQWMSWRADPDSAPLAQRVRTLLDAGAKVSRQNLDTPVALQSRDPRRAWALATLTGVAVMASLSWAVWQHARGMSRLATAAPSGVDSAFSHSVAVLPFVDMSALQDQGYFGDGLTEELIDLLSRGSDLRVPARTSSFFFKGKQVPLTDVARALSVAYILEGSVRKSGDTMRVTAQLVRANDGYHVWSDSYDRELRDVFKVQDEIAAAVVAALRAKLSAQRDVASGTTRSPEAYEQYLIARDLIRQTGLGNYKRALSAYQRALELDPDFAGALIGAADANYLLIVGQGPISKEQLSGVVTQLTRAIEIAPELPDGYSSRGIDLLETGRDLELAEADLRKALLLAPQASVNQRRYGTLLMCRGNVQGGLEYSLRATELDPLDVFGWNHLAYAQLIAGHLEDARRALEWARQISPDSELVKDNLAMLLLLEGRATELLRVIDQLASDRMRQALKAMAEFSAGFEQQSQQTLREFAASAAPDQYYNVAQVYAWRGDVRKASDWLQRSVGYQRGDAACLRGDPLMTKLYSEPQIHAVLTHNHLE